MSQQETNEGAPGEMRKREEDLRRVNVAPPRNTKRLNYLLTSTQQNSSLLLLL